MIKHAMSNRAAVPAAHSSKTLTIRLLELRTHSISLGSSITETLPTV
ncbi:MAG: hypothetical protein JWM90_1508 [Thermoleophilia bacterium]|nr:hypothetical protein [Thermoleophilia bacterium]